MDKKATSARKSQSAHRLTDAERHKRFVEMAREVGASDRPQDFDKAFKKVVPSKPLAKKKMSDHWLESVFWASQAILTLVAVLAAFAAFSQIRTFKLFEMLKFIEAPPIRQSRRIVLREIYPQKDEVWWNDERLEAAASDVCSNYDILGLMIERDCLGGYGVFERYWARSILDTHEALERFIHHRRERNSGAYTAFSRLAERVRPHAGIVRGVLFQPR